MRRTPHLAALPWIAAWVAVWVAAAPVAAQDTERIYTQACEAGDAIACNVFGLMLETGEGVARDEARAAAFYERACAAGALIGCVNLGILRETGRGVDANLGAALQLYLVACDGGETLGCERLSALGAAAPADETTELLGLVAAAESGEALADALVTLPEIPMAAVSGVEGAFALTGLSAGAHRVRVERLGYTPLDTTLTTPLAGGALFALRADPRDPAAGPGRVTGTVRSDTGAPLAGVEVSVAGGSAEPVLSDGAGRFTLPQVAPGLVRVRFSRLGYSDRVLPAVVQAGRLTTVAAAMRTEPVDLQGLTVSVESRYLERSGFFSRAARAGGRFFDRTALESSGVLDVSDLVHRVPGVSLQWGGYGQRQAVSRRGGVSWQNGGCVLPVYVDGIPTMDADLDRVPIHDIDAIEVYDGQAFLPAFVRTNPCGAVLIWTGR